MKNLTNYVRRINERHLNATKHANEAIFHATEAGKLLIACKGSLPHGEFTKWIINNLSVSPRQARRYMLVAEGKSTTIQKLKVPASSKMDIMSVLPVVENATENSTQSRSTDLSFLPTNGQSCAYVDSKNNTFLIESNKNALDYFFVMRISGTELVYDKRGCSAEAVPLVLRILGLPNTEVIAWTTNQTSGVRYAGETLQLTKEVELWPSSDDLSWRPIQSHWITCQTETAKFWVIPARNLTDQYFVSVGPLATDYLERSTWFGCELQVPAHFKKPTSGATVSGALRQLGLHDPASADWQHYPTEGLDRPAYETEPGALFLALYGTPIKDVKHHGESS